MLAKLFVTTESRRKHSFVTKSTQARDLSEGIFSFFWDYSFSSFGPNLLYRRQSHGYYSCSCFFRGLFCHFKLLPLAKLVNNFHLTAYSWLNPENPRNLANVCQKKWMEEDVFFSPCCFVSQHSDRFPIPSFRQRVAAFLCRDASIQTTALCLYSAITKLSIVSFLSLKDFAPNKMTTMPT